MPIQSSELTIHFPEQITTASIEKTLCDYYRKSCNAKADSVVFDLGSCEWCEMYGLSLLSLWIWELKSSCLLHTSFVTSQ